MPSRHPCTPLNNKTCSPALIDSLARIPSSSSVTRPSSRSLLRITPGKQPDETDGVIHLEYLQKATLKIVASVMYLSVLYSSTSDAIPSGMLLRISSFRFFASAYIERSVVLVRVKIEGVVVSLSTINLIYC